MKTCLPVLIVLIAASASTGVWAQEWRPIDASRTVHFTAAGLEKTTPIYTARQDTVHFAWREFSPWRGASGVRAEILHSQLAPGWVFTLVYTLFAALVVLSFVYYRPRRRQGG